MKNTVILTLIALVHISCNKNSTTDNSGTIENQKIIGTWILNTVYIQKYNGGSFSDQTIDYTRSGFSGTWTFTEDVFTENLQSPSDTSSYSGMYKLYGNLMKVDNVTKFDVTELTENKLIAIEEEFSSNGTFSTITEYKLSR